MPVIQHNPDGVFPPYRAYSHAMEVRGESRLLFISGLNGYEQDGTTMPESFDEQAELIWGHIRTILASADMEFGNIVSLRTYLSDPKYDEQNVLFAFDQSQRLCAVAWLTIEVPMDRLTINALAAFPQQLEAHYDAVPAEFKHWAPPSWEGVPSEPLTAIEQVCHVRDIEIDGYHVRLHRTLTEFNPTLASIDTDALAKERSYGMSNASAAFAAFREARSHTVALLNGLTPEQLGRTAVFEGYGPVSLRSLVHYLCSHDQQHLAGVQWLLGKMEGSRVRVRS